MSYFHFAQSCLFPVLLGIGALTAAAPLQAASIQTFLFSGVCDPMDCTGFGTGTLVLTNYTQGTAIGISNFVTFSYGGTNLLAPFVILQADVTSLVGNIPNGLPGPGTLVIDTNNAPLVNNLTRGLVVSTVGVSVPVLPFFNTFPGGNWSAGESGLIFDFGNNGIFTQQSGVPEPSSVLLIGAGLAAIFLRRRQS